MQYLLSLYFPSINRTWNQWHTAFERQGLPRLARRLGNAAQNLLLPGRRGQLSAVFRPVIHINTKTGFAGE
jgi:hypothetical protein